MNKKLYIMMGIIFVISISIGGTLSFVVSEIRTSSDTIDIGSNKFSVDVSTTGPLEGNITLTTSKAEGLSTEVGVKMNAESVLSKASLYIHVDDISDNKLSNNTISWKKALIWELYKIDGNNEVLIKTGNFLECSTTGQKTCVNGDKLYMYKDFQLTYSEQEFVVYIWLDGEIADNGVEGAYIKASIAAETEQFSADLR